MLYLTKLIGRGGTRECYYHPQNKNLCIKVMQAGKPLSSLFHELKIYQQVHSILGSFICHYSPTLVETDKGLGLECELISDSNNQPSQPILSYVIQHRLNEAILSQLQEFFSLLIKNNIFFYDFNLMNFVIKQTDSGPRLIYIDMKSYRHYKPWTYLGFEKFIPSLAQHIMKRRIKSMYQKLGLPSPF